MPFVMEKAEVCDRLCCLQFICIVDFISCLNKLFLSQNGLGISLYLLYLAYKSCVEQNIVEH